MTGAGPAAPTVTVLAISSWVAAGHVGLSAATPVLQALGARVLGLPTVMLSNHAGWPAVAGAPTPPERLTAMLDAIEANGWLGEVDAVLTGYLPSAEHVAEAARCVARLRAIRPDLRVVVDPVLGDAPKGLYVPQAVAEAIRDELLSGADILTPNRFELAWLSGLPVDGRADARAAAAALPGPGDRRRVCLTSPPLGPSETGVLEMIPSPRAPQPDEARLFRTPRRDGVPHGVGDVFAALLASGASAGQALGWLDALISASLGAPHLRIAEARAHWSAAGPIPASEPPDA